MQRYTLPYREETRFPDPDPQTDTIHPPIQGGNPVNFLHAIASFDTPSHTGRKRYIDSNEEGVVAIHPPIQGGNRSITP